MDEFRFVAEEGFFIWNRCIAFHGHVTSGEIKTNDEVEIHTSEGSIYAHVNIIVPLSTSKVIEKSILDEKIGIGIDRFEKGILKALWAKYDPNVDTAPPPLENFLKITYPLVIKKK